MGPTDVLSGEHRVIEQVLGCLQTMIDRACSGQKLDVASARDAIAFFRTFADACHHAKEENQLFKALEKRGFSPHFGPVAVMLQEHDQGRTAIKDMVDALDRLDAGQPGAADIFVLAAREYIELLTQHISKEDQILFPMAAGVLSPAEQADVLAAFERAEHDELGPGTHEKFLAIADALGAKYDVKRKESCNPKQSGCCAHHH